MRMHTFLLYCDENGANKDDPETVKACNLYEAATAFVKRHDTDRKLLGSSTKSVSVFVKRTEDMAWRKFRVMPRITWDYTAIPVDEWNDEEE
jgi:hypothetical protein